MVQGTLTEIKVVIMASPTGSERARDDKPESVLSLSGSESDPDESVFEVLRALNKSGKAFNSSGFQIRQHFIETSSVYFNPKHFNSSPFFSHFL